MSTVTRDPSVKAQVEASLLVHSPLRTWQLYGEALGLSLSAIYRHANKLRDTPAFRNAPVWVGDLTTGELIGDQARLFKSHLEQRDAALGRRDWATGSREGTGAQRVGADLDKVGVTNEQVALKVEFADLNSRILVDLLAHHPEVKALLDESAKRIHAERAISVFDTLAENAANLPTTTKE